MLKNAQKPEKSPDWEGLENEQVPEVGEHQDIGNRRAQERKHG